MLAIMNLRSIDKVSMRKRWKISIIAVTMKALTAMAIKSLGLIFSISGVNAPNRRTALDLAGYAGNRDGAFECVVVKEILYVGIELSAIEYAVESGDIEPMVRRRRLARNVQHSKW